MECKWEMNIFYLFSLGSKIKKSRIKPTNYVGMFSHGSRTTTPEGNCPQT